MDKTISDLAVAVAVVEDGMTVMIGGFGGSGAPIELIHALIDRFLATGSPKNLIVINNNAGNGHVGLAALIEQGMVRKLICSFPRSADPRVFTERYLASEIELELIPQGTLAERIRAGGAGIPAFYTPTSFGTDLANGKPVEQFDGRSYVRELWLKADVALIKAQRGDRLGNLVFNAEAWNSLFPPCGFVRHGARRASWMSPFWAPTRWPKRATSPTGPRGRRAFRQWEGPWIWCMARNGSPSSPTT